MHQGRHIEAVLSKTELRLFDWGDLTQVLCYYNGGLQTEGGIERWWTHGRTHVVSAAVRLDEGMWNWLCEISGDRL
jgi:hypothetical protein